jgi:hypothetical protein
VVAHVGDTRCAVLRDDRLRTLTHDHVLAHPDFQHTLVRCLGQEDQVVVDYLQGDLGVGDVFLLTSDGVHGVLPPERMRALLGEGDATAQARALVNAALAAGSTDNVTAVVVRVQGLRSPDFHDHQRKAEQLPVPPLMKVGSVLDGLVVTALVADTGVNLLYQVRDPETQRLYACKALHPSRAHDQQERAMLAHEIWLARRLGESRAAGHLVVCHDRVAGGRSPSAFYGLFDWHAGKTWAQWLAMAPPDRLSPAQVVQGASGVLKVLGQLHRQGIVHRDIKPANLHLGDDGVLRVLDLGVALSGREPEAMRNLHAGTPSFINPEQWGYRVSDKSGLVSSSAEPEAPDAQSDLFALGVTLYQMLAGHLPYGDVLPYQVGRYHRDPVPLVRHNPQVPMWLNHVVLKAIARDKRLRFETAEEFLLALERGASRPLTVPAASPLLQRDPTALWKLLLGVSLLFNLLLVFWLLFLPR